MDDRASWDEDEFTLSPRRDALAETLLVLGREVPPGWTLRCCRSGDEVRAEARLTVGELVDRVRRGSLSRYELYRVVDDGPA